MTEGIEVRLSAILGERKLKISKVAVETGLSRTTLTKLYYDQSSAISFDVLNCLCGYLNCEIGDLLKLRTPDHVGSKSTKKS